MPSTSPSHRSAQGTTLSPTLSRSASLSSRTTDRPGFTVEPKSEYLRSALEARRAKNASVSPSPSPSGMRLLSERTHSFESFGDPWLEQAMSEEGTLLPSPIRRNRRPSESGLPRMPTQREQQTENEALKDRLFNSKLQLELLKKQNNELKDQIEEANKQIAEVQPLEEENIELRELNNHLILKLQDLEEELVHLDDKNVELLQIQGETVVEMEKHHHALDEAADVIHRLEQEKIELQEEIERWKQAANNQSSNRSEYNEAFDGQAKERRPSRVYSIDESRPSTSHFDSDYYSQPASPQVKLAASKETLSYSARAKSFLNMNKESKRSMQDLKKRFSDVSIKNMSRVNSPPPEVPKIPDMCNNAYTEAQSAERTETLNEQETRRSLHMPSLNMVTLVGFKDNARGVSNFDKRSPTPTTPGQKEGLRNFFRDRRSYPSSSTFKSPTPSRKSRYSSMIPAAIVLPQRDSSRFAQTSVSEHLGGSSSRDLHPEPTGLSSEYHEHPPARPSFENEDLMSIPDSQRWWKDLGKVQSNFV